MRRIVFILILIGAAVAASARLRGPKMEVADNLWAGTVTQDSVLTFNVPVVNLGTADLEISRINRSCQCMEVDVPDGPIAPGDTAVLSVTFDSHPFNPGYIQKYFTIVSNDADYLHRVYFRLEILPGQDKNE